MKNIGDDFGNEQLFAVLKLAHNAQSRAVAALVGREVAASTAPIADLCTSSGFEVCGAKTYSAPGIQSGSPPIYLSYNEIDSDALVVRPLGWIEPQDDRERLRELFLATPQLPSGGYALARLGDRDLLVFVEHLATQSLDESEIRCALASARMAGIAASVDSGSEPTGWFNREIDCSVVDKIDTFLLSRPTPWRRAPESGREDPAWICDGVSALAAFFDSKRGVLVLARSFRSFVGAPKPEMCMKLLQANLRLLDGRFAALRDNTHGAVVLLNHVCCDDLDDVELMRAVGYLERIELRGARHDHSGLQLLGLLERCEIAEAQEPVEAFSALQTEGPKWAEKIELGMSGDGNKLELPVSDFLTHAFVCGGSGSGKTIVCKNIIEKLAQCGVPSIVIDLKGDLSSLACVPDGASTAAAASYLLRLHGDSASLNGASIESLAKQTERNCEGSSIGDKDVRAFRDAVEFRILTPRSDVGIPMALSPLSGLDLGSVGESGGILGNRALHELVDSNLRGLVDYLELSDVDAETLVAVLIQLLEAAHREGNTLSGIEGIERLVQLLFEVHEKTERINFLETADAIDEKKAQAYARAMNARLGGTFRYWFDGENLSIDELVAPRDGRIPINIVNLSMLPTARDQGYAIAQINSQIIEWMRAQAGAQRPRLVYFIDEIAQGGGKEAIFPPAPFNPITKSGLNVILKQGRAFGVSCLLSTQNAKDIDYKGLGQCDTWIVGRLKTSADIDRLKLGIEAADAGSGSGFGRGGEDALAEIAGLEPGTFLIKTRSQGVFTYKQRWINSLHERMTPEMLKNWVTAEELRIESRFAEASLNWSQGDPRSAVEALEKIINDEPYYSKLAESKLMLCEWLFRLEEWSRVVDYASILHESVRGRSGFELLHYYEGMANFETGNLDTAKIALGRFVESASPGAGELIERCRDRLKDLCLKQDDYAGLQEVASQDAKGGASKRLLLFCRTMQSALTSWPALRGGALENATVMATEVADDPDKIHYARRGDACVHSYVADIRRRLDDLPLAPTPIEPLSVREQAQLEQILLNAQADADSDRANLEAVERELALAEEHIGALQLDAASDAIDVARKLVLETGVGREAMEGVISLYRGACSAGATSIRNWLMEIDPFEFELEIAALFRNLGYEAQATKPTGDGGVDVCATYRNRQYVIQCKRYRHAIEPGQIREFATVIRNFDADEGIFVTTSTFTQGCREEAESHGIHLMEMEDLVGLYAGRADDPGRSGRGKRESVGRRNKAEGAVDPGCEAKIRQVLFEASGSLRMVEIAERSGYETAACQEVIGGLLAEHLVLKHGRARGTRYQLA